jgi:hypothetical protein
VHRIAARNGSRRDQRELKRVMACSLPVLKHRSSIWPVACLL